MIFAVSAHFAARLDDVAGPPVVTPQAWAASTALVAVRADAVRLTCAVWAGSRLAMLCAAIALMTQRIFRPA